MRVLSLSQFLNQYYKICLVFSQIIIFNNSNVYKITDAQKNKTEDEIDNWL